jgi:hypothetical protein
MAERPRNDGIPKVAGAITRLKQLQAITQLVTPQSSPQIPFLHFKDSPNGSFFNTSLMVKQYYRKIHNSVTLLEHARA